MHNSKSGTNHPDYERLIITGASRVYGPYLLALLGSLNLNWPDHPPVLVYDIGLDAGTLSVLHMHRIPVRPVPAFCSHWRKHYTWKVWCWHDAPAHNVLWLDAAQVMLQCIDEVFETIAQQGYFVVPSGDPLTESASESACHGCGVTPDFRTGKITVAGGIVGFRKECTMLEIIQEALSISLIEEHIAATRITHRHDEAILSLLLYKHLGRITAMDETIYAGWTSPHAITGQKVWAHRRSLRPKDLRHFRTHIAMQGKPYIPSPSSHRQYPLLAWLRQFRRVHSTAIYNGVRD